MTKEQESIVIEELNQLIDKSRDLREEEFYTIFTIHEVQNIETVLNMLKEKDKKIEKLKTDNKKAWKLNANMSQRHLSDIFKINKKDKQIDLMAEYISKIDIEEDICIKNKTNPDWCNEDYTNCKNCIKQYFERKAKDGRN